MSVAPSSLLRRASADDIPYVMQVERLPGYETLVARWTLAQHREALARSDVAYFVGEGENGERAGFAICEGVGDRHNGIKLKRIAVSNPGVGIGRSILSSVMAWSFRDAGAPRFWLDVFDYNVRARRMYRDAGLQEEGRLRSAYELPDGRRVDRIVMSMLAAEWHPD
jgi:diamine N-acetyltransferase